MVLRSLPQRCCITLLIPRDLLEAQNPLKHGNSSKALWRVFKRMLHIFQYSLLLNSLFDLSLGFDIKRISVQPLDISLLRELCFGLSLVGSPQEFRETSRVVLSCFCYLWLCL